MRFPRRGDDRHRTFPALRRASRAIGLTAILAGCTREAEPPARTAVSLDSAQTLPASAPVAPAIALDLVAAAIQAGAGSGRVPLMEKPALGARREDLGRLYEESWAPLWVDEAGRPTPAAADAIAAIRTAPEDGLDSLDYSGARLDSVATVLSNAATRSPLEVGRFDLALSLAFLRYVGDLHAGRVEPAKAGFKLSASVDRHDVPMQIRSALSDGSLPQLVLTQRPTLVIYSRLKEALAQYRALADSATDSVPPVTTSVKPGDTSWIGVPALEKRLRLLGDLTNSTSSTVDGRPPTGYDSVLVEAVKRFQDRHGLEPDGVIGKGTVAALNVPVSRRVEQILLSLERLRWIPDLEGDRFIVVNIPTFHLWAWDSLNAEGAPSIDMNVIVGRNTLNTQTPVFVEQMRYVIFRPYWNVPPSILRSETLPAIRKDPENYLARNDMEIVQGQGDDARPVAATPENIALLAKGQLRVRQRPGPRNSLGLVKFMFPNDENVYLHSTPAQELFNRNKRDFSHGCVRVERPVDLGVWVLREVAGWDHDKIVGAMKEGKPTRVNLPRPLPVILFYTTAIAGLDGRPQFFEDVYGHDAKLEKALATR
ncbi:MAG TPA: L,D-transpeptidase family protein [Gemmatimonadales bacterium]|nr:L,D-transpeptidase family protein [Gemmatimonadales bacterium]